MTKELLRELTKPARMAGLAAGRITRIKRFQPRSSSVAALPQEADEFPRLYREADIL
ncbi:hypothetical protein GCWU000341_00039 [Oribacterium sp. oral taxon 078 str. F0262]|nr:hypothetical protein GCWU000341_00039 [Oribacterium sp. oral taxon 078 str. F0262]